jgi:ribose 5-phosphate isomerase B
MLANGSDHGGLALKEVIKKQLTDLNIEFEDMGTYTTDSVDYPEYGAKVARAVASGQCERGIIICGTGIGISIAANKIKGIRAALCNDVFSAQMSREHNDANILALGERVTGPGLAQMIVEKWLTTPFGGDRHARRVAKLMELENE